MNFGLKNTTFLATTLQTPLKTAAFLSMQGPNTYPSPFYPHRVKKFNLVVELGLKRMIFLQFWPNPWLKNTIFLAITLQMSLKTAAFWFV